MKILIVALLLLMGVRAEAQKRAGGLRGYAVVLDPGHGGTDPGAWRLYEGKKVLEGEYVYDISLRVARLIRARHGLAFLTVKGDGKERNTPASSILEKKEETFAKDGSEVQANMSGLLKRVEYGNQIKRKYSAYELIWISIHFDVVGERDDVEGVRLIAADTNSRVAKALRESFRKDGRLRAKDALVPNGDPAHGIRHLVVLSPRNQIKEKVLVELGNFLNDRDLYRIRSPEVRQKYAEAIVNALTR
jgi:N-acetylmuramoyl-L-alanine amidase